MKHHPQKRMRRSIRLKNFDYRAPGAYFVTICTQGYARRFGEISDDEMQLNDAGEMVKSEWLNLPQRFPATEIDEFIIMPNHVHGILWIVEVGAPLVGAQNGGLTEPNRAGTRPAPTLGEIIGAFKSITTNKYILGVRHNGWQPFDRKLWQQNYYERIIRNERELNAIREYVINNPLNWALDRENPLNLKGKNE